MTNQNVSSCSMHDLIYQLPEMIYVTTQESVFVMANHFTKKLFGYSSFEALEGDTYDNMPGPAAELSEIFKDQDKKVIDSGGSIKVAGCFRYSNDERKVLFGYKRPRRIQPGVIELFCTFMDITNNNNLNIHLSPSVRQVVTSNDQKSGGDRRNDTCLDYH